ncbi:MAG TPA: HAD domain-containing protein [Acidimicrobiales bacterium]|nr:HAD domain-containing protein [Acidimicrobiales bacterium]
MSRPLLFVDIDGVLNPYAAPSCPEGYVERVLFPDEEPVRLCVRHREWLIALAEVYDLVWATAWNEADRTVLTSILALPAFAGAIELPNGPFDPREKVPAVERLAGNRPLAWVDDMLGPEAWTWSSERSEPTLLLPVDPAVGLTEDDVKSLLDWATTGYGLDQ